MVSARARTIPLGHAKTTTFLAGPRCDGTIRGARAKHLPRHAREGNERFNRRRAADAARGAAQNSRVRPSSRRWRT